MEKFIRKLKLRAMYKRMQRYYNCNPRFCEYADRCAAQKKVPAQEVLRHALTREVAKYYQELDAEEDGRIPAGKSTYAPIGECL